MDRQNPNDINDLDISVRKKLREYNTIFFKKLNDTV